MESNTYMIKGKQFELQHHGVKGMKWGRRKARPETIGTGRTGGKSSTDSLEAQAAAKESRRRKAKRAAKIGAAVVTTALAAYGAKKLHDVIRHKNESIKLERAKDHIRRMIESDTWDSPYIRAKTGKSRGDRARDILTSARRNAASDSFGAAVKNVVGDYMDRRRRE